MDSRHLRYFVTTAETGSFASAGNAEYVSPQAVSKTVSELERDIGMRLFDRTRTGVVLTPFGEMYYRKASKALAMLSALDDMARTAGKKNDAGQLTIRLAISSYPSLRGALVGEESFQEYCQMHPDVDLRLFFGSPVICASAFQEQAMDAALIIGPWDETKGRGCWIADIRPTLIMDADHPLAASARVRIDDLRNYPIAFPGDCGFLYQELIRACAKKGFQPTLVQVPAAVEHCRSFMTANRGVMFTASDPALADMYPHSVFVETELPCMPLAFCFREGEFPSLMVALKDYVIRVARGIIEECTIR